MNKFAFIALAACILPGCRNTNAPDVSGIRMDVKFERFDQFLFTKLDTADAAHGLKQLQAAFPYFAPDFITNILELPAPSYPFTDSISAGTFSELKRFIRLTRPVYDSVSPAFPEAESRKALTQAFRYLKYYFPDYPVPQIVAYVGPLNAPGVAVTNRAIAVGLQLYGGKEFSFYTNEEGIAMYPQYISRRFEPQYIPVNVMTAVTDDMFPDKNGGRSLIEQMVEKGKQWYMLDKLLPEAPDSLKTGYTRQQLEWCRDNEGLVWNFFLQSNELYTTEAAFIQQYLGEAPTTQDMPASSPGNIGQWTGWQIVKAYAKKHPDILTRELMNTDAKKIFAASKYKPRYK